MTLKTCLAAFGVLACLSAARADGTIVKLNDYAVIGEGDKIAVLGSKLQSGSSLAANIFDGNTATFFDGPSGENWVGFELRQPMVVTKVKYWGRNGFRYRMLDCEFQGANTADFSDAETLAVVNPTDAWNGNSWEETTSAFDGSKTYKYLRIISRGSDMYYTSFGVGNATEVEFYGYEPGEQFAPVDTAPTVTPQYSVMNNSFCVTVPVLADAQLQVQRKEKYDADWIEVRMKTCDVTANEQTIVFADRFSGNEADYRFRYVKGNGVSEWVVLKATANYNALKGTLISQTIRPYDTPARYGQMPARAFDGNLLSYVEVGAPFWMGLDLGKARTINGIRFLPRNGLNRMQNSRFEVSDTLDFANPTVIHSLTGEPAHGAITDVRLQTPVTARYVRWYSQSPANNCCNTEEIEFYTDGWAPTEAPLNPTLAFDGSKDPEASFTWSNDPAVFHDKVVVYRSLYAEGPWTEIAELDRGATSFKDEDTKVGFQYFYKLAYRVEIGSETWTGEMSDTVAAFNAHRLERDWTNLSQVKSGMTPIHEGDYQVGGNVAENVFDDDPSSFCDAKKAAVGVDFGSGVKLSVGLCRVYPRTSNATMIARLNGAQLFGADELPTDGSDWPLNHPLTDPFVVTAANYYTFVVKDTTPYRYVFVSKVKQPNATYDLYGNVSELELYGWTEEEYGQDRLAPPPSVSAARQPTGIAVTWDEGKNAATYRVERSAAGQTTWATVAGGLTGLSFLDETVADGGYYNYRVIACRDDEEAPSASTAPVRFFTPGEGTGLYARYQTGFHRDFLDEASETATYATDPSVDFDWGSGMITTSDGREIAKDYVRVDWMGELEIPFEGHYVFKVESDDGVALVLDETNDVINNWKSGGTFTSESIYLTAGRHPIHLAYNEVTGGAKVRLLWGGDVSEEVIPQSQLHPAAEGAFDLPAPWVGQRGFVNDRFGVCNFAADGKSAVIGTPCNTGDGGAAEFLWQNLKGNFDASFRYSRPNDGLGNSNLGLFLMARAANTNGTPFVATAVNIHEGNVKYAGWEGKYRTVQGGSVKDDPGWSGKLEKSGYLRLTREGNVFTMMARETMEDEWQVLATYTDVDKAFGKILAVGPAITHSWNAPGQIRFVEFSEFKFREENEFVIMVR